MTKLWNVFLPGPSLAKLTHRPSGEIVTVNAAIRHEIVGDYFAALDTPMGLGARSKPGEWNYDIWQKLVRVGPRVWVDQICQDDWRKNGFPNSESWDWHHAKALGLGWLPPLMRRSMFYAILGCLIHGAKEIHLWGCDFEGTSYFDGPGATTVDRWPRESMRLEKIQEAAELEGIRIARR